MRTHGAGIITYMRRTQRNKPVIGAIVLAAVLAAVFISVFAIEKLQQRKTADEAAAAASQRQSEKDDLLDELEDSEWDGDNTLYLNGGLYGYDHRIETWLLIGTDESGNESGTGEEYRGAMADFLLLMVVDHTDDRYGFLQIDRNTITEVPMVNTEGETTDYQDMQLCVAHWYGGNPEESAENTVDSVSTLLGELDPITGYYVLTMDRIGMMNAAVGGVEITFDEDMTPADPAFVKGTTLTLTDEQAERFVRARMSFEDDANANRMSRQRIFMNAFLKKAVKLTKENPNFANKLWDTMKDGAVTDMNGNAFSRIAEALRKDEDTGIHTFEGTTKIGKILDDKEEHEEFFPDEQSKVDVLTELFTLQYLGEEEE